MKQLHVLINEDSAGHYDVEGVSAIEEMERGMSIREGIGFARASIFKYKFRKDHKGQKDSDEKKIETYELYLGALYTLLRKGVDERNSVERGWELTQQVWRFR